MNASQTISAQHALIVQMQAALESCDAGAVEDGGRQWYDDKLVEAALEAAEAYLRDPEACLRQDVERFALIGDPGAECVRNGHGYWELHRDGELVCPLSPQTRQFIDSAIRACISAGADAQLTTSSINKGMP